MRHKAKPSLIDYVFFVSFLFWALLLATPLTINKSLGISKFRYKDVRNDETAAKLNAF